MTTNQNPIKRRIMIAAIPVLVAILAAALYNNLSPRSASIASPAPPTVSQKPAAPGMADSAASTPVVLSITANRWPEFELEDIISFDPFTPNASANREVAAGQSSNGSPSGASIGDSAAPTAANGVSAPQQALPSKVQAVYQRGDNTAAIVGSRVVQPGDTLDEGATVVAVHARGVIVDLPADDQDALDSETDDQAE